MSMSTYAANLVLATFYGDNAADAAPTILYLAFFDGDPAGAGSELTNTEGVSRILITNDGTNFGAPVAGVVANAGVWESTPAVGPWASDADHWAFYDDPVGGNLIESGLVVDGSGVATTLTVILGTIVTVPVGTWVLTQPTS
jgi:hypothetical protein